MKFDTDLSLNLWYQLNPRVRCAFGNVWCSHSPLKGLNLIITEISITIFSSQGHPLRAPTSLLLGRQWAVLLRLTISLTITVPLDKALTRSPSLAKRSMSTATWTHVSASTGDVMEWCISCHFNILPWVNYQWFNNYGGGARRKGLDSAVETYWRTMIIIIIE